MNKKEEKAQDLRSLQTLAEKLREEELKDMLLKKGLTDEGAVKAGYRRIPRKAGTLSTVVRLDKSQADMINLGYKDSDGIMMLPFVFKQITDDMYEMVHLIDVKQGLYERLFTLSVDEHINPPRKGDKREIQLWMEGYAATGESGTAQFIGLYKAYDFDDAVRQYIEDHPEFKENALPSRYTRESFSSDEAFASRRSNWKIWGCALFDNEADARKAFG